MLLLGLGSLASIPSSNKQTDSNNKENLSILLQQRETNMHHRDLMRWAEVSHEHSSAPTIKNHSVTHFGGYLFCFGGYDGRRNHMTLLLYSIAEQRWIRPHQQGDSAVVVVQGTPPPGRNGHSATLAVDDEENAKIVIIGGWLGTGPLAASDMHVLDVSAGGRSLRWYQPPVKGTPPGPCNMHSADYVSSRREVFVFRGGNGREYLNDLHALNVDTLTWRKVETRGEIPQPRANHSSAILEETQELVLFGGWNGNERLNDIHILDTITSTWTCPRVGGVLPHPRAGMTITSNRGKLYLFGGSGTSAKCFNDLQILDRQEMVWLDVSQAEPSENKPSGNNNNNTTNSHPEYDGTDDTLAFRFGGELLYANNARAFGNTAYPDEEGAQGAPYSSSRADWRSRDMAGQIQHTTAGIRSMHVSPNPNDEDTVPSVLLHGRGPGRRAGHTATAVHSKIYIFGGSCGTCSNTFFFFPIGPSVRTNSHGFLFLSF
jgi:hypothetical protein